MVAAIKKQWNNGGRPTIVSIGVGTLLTIMVTVAAILHTTATSRFSAQLSQMQASLRETKELIQTLDQRTTQQIRDSEARTSAQVSQSEERLSKKICDVRDGLTRRVERVEDQLQARGARWTPP